MNSIKITNEIMEEVLPQNIKDTDILNDDAKKVLAVIINYFFTLDKVKQHGYVILSNDTLRKAAGINKNNTIYAVRTLVQHKLVERVLGCSRTVGQKAMASEYRIIWENLQKPLQKITFDTLFSEFIKPSETPFGTAETDTESETESEADTDTELDTEIETKKENNNITINNNDLIKEKEMKLNDEDYFDYLNYLNSIENNVASTPERCSPKEEVAPHPKTPEEAERELDEFAQTLFGQTDDTELQKKREANKRRMKELLASEELQRSLELSEKEYLEWDRQDKQEQLEKRWGKLASVAQTITPSEELPF